MIIILVNLVKNKRVLQNDLLYDPDKVFNPVKKHMPPVYCRYTPFLRIRPDFFLVGVQKGGTTSLFEALHQHPQIIASKAKEMFYYGNTINFKKGKSYYKQFFATRFYKSICEQKINKTCYAIDASTDSFESKKAPARIFTDNANAKIVIILRNPVERAFSHYKFAVKLGYEKASFEKALELEEERLSTAVKESLTNAEHNYAFLRLGYRARGLYCNYISNWYSVFEEKNIFVTSSESFFKEPKAVYNKLTDFLGLARNENVDFKKLNVGSDERMNPETFKQLEEFYKPYNEKLFSVVKSKYNW